MEITALSIGAALFVSGLCIGYLVSFARAQKRILFLSSENAQLGERVQALNSQISTEREFFAESEEALRQSFRSLSQEALQANSSQLISLTKGELDGKHALIDQLGRQLLERLQLVDKSLKELEMRRTSSESQLTTQLQTLTDFTKTLSGETARLRGALSSTRHLGTWGEAQLRNVLTSAGLLAHCDFIEQPVTAEHGSQVRPDVIVKLPNGRTVIIDAKAPATSFLESAHATDPQLKQAHLKSFSEAMRRHVRATGQRKYPTLFPNALPFTLVFLPGEVFLFAALESDPEIIREAEECGVLVCTPLSLIAFLKTVALSWQEANVHAHVKEIQSLGYELFERLETFVEGFNNVGKALGSAVKHFNQASGSLERRLMVSARRFRELEGSSPSHEPKPMLLESQPEPTHPPTN